jgi:hypothetical protein
MNSGRKSHAILTTALLACAACVSLSLAPRAAHAAGSCEVTVYTTKPDGEVDGDVKPQTRACRPGETNGGTEYYNPYTGHYDFRVPIIGGNGITMPPSGVPSSGSDSTASNSSSGVQSGCTSAASGGTKSKAQKIQTATQHTCATPSSGAPSR